MKGKIKLKIRKWLGISDLYRRVAVLEELYANLTNIGVDVHFKSPHMILIFSKLNGGQLRHIDAEFGSLKELNDFVLELKKRYRAKDVFFDAPNSCRDLFKG